MAQDSILNLMVIHHALIETMSSLFRDEANEKLPRATITLSELNWEIRKHFFIEENAIFDYLPLKTMDIYKKILHLKEEHVTMIGYLEKFTADLSVIKNEEIEEFYKLLKEHREDEEKELYPILDREIHEEQKTQIIHRINEVPVKINLEG